jgi:hypothetical protein
MSLSERRLKHYFESTGLYIHFKKLSLSLSFACAVRLGLLGAWCKPNWRFSNKNEMGRRRQWTSAEKCRVVEPENCWTGIWTAFCNAHPFSHGIYYKEFNYSVSRTDAVNFPDILQNANTNPSNVLSSFTKTGTQACVAVSNIDCCK